jgi:hypothetical protein
MSTDNSYRAIHAAAVSLFESDGRIGTPFAEAGEWRPPRPSTSATSRCGDCSRPEELSQALLHASRGLTTVTFSLHSTRQ